MSHEPLYEPRTNEDDAVGDGAVESEVPRGAASG